VKGRLKEKKGENERDEEEKGKEGGKEEE